MFLCHINVETHFCSPGFDPRRGSVAVPLLYVASDPLASTGRTGLRGHPSEVGEAGLSQVGWIRQIPLPSCRSSGQGVCLLISLHSLVGWGPSDCDAVASTPELVREVHRCSPLVCVLVFANPLHAARRAMAAACRCPRGLQRFSHPL